MPPDDSTPTVVLNDLSLYRQKSGVAFYVLELLRAMPAADSRIRVVRLSQTLIGRPLRAASKLYESSMRAGGVGLTNAVGLRRLLGRGVKAVRDVGHAALDQYLSAASRLVRWPVYHEPDAVPARVDAPTVTSIHDLSVLLYPHWHPPHRVRKYEQRFAEGLTRSRLFITMANSTKADMIRLLGVPAERIHAVHAAPRPEFQRLSAEVVAAARRRLSLPERFILCVGTIEPRKNVAGLLRAYANLPPQLRSDFPLLLAGGWGWRSDDVREMLGRAPWSEHVRWLGYLPDDDLVAVTNAAELMVYPSHYEGFGLPPLEAMACGLPVITSHCGSLREVVGDAARIVDPGDDDALTLALEELLTSPELADEYRERGRKRAAGFNWAETARRTAEAYRKAA